MEQDFVLISRQNIDDLITMMKRARGYCLSAQSVRACKGNDEPTASYPGASGYAGATLGEVISNLEAHL